MPRDELAKLAGYSVPHFHRMFTAHGGESITAYIRRVRMERAAQQLLSSDLSVTEIALSHGYDTHSAFDKAFKQQFGYNPSEFRLLNRIWAGHLIHKHIYYPSKEKIMQPLEIKTLPDIKVLYARATEVMASPAFQTANREAFGKLMAYLSQQQAMHKMRQCIAIYPSEVEVGQVAIMDAGAVFAPGDEISAGDGLAYQTLPGGRWAIFRHVGPYDTLWQTWHAALRDWLPASGCEFRETPPFEDYVDDPSQTAPEVLRTDIYIPIR